MNLILLGPPGAGKGTQAKRVAEAFKLLHLSSGDILRAERENKTELGRQAQAYMDRGDLVPDDLIVTMMQERMSRPEAQAGVVLDGFPRTEAQAVRLDERLAEKNTQVDVVVCLELDDALVEDRLTGRVYCPQCGHTYHTAHSPPKAAGACDACGQGLQRRPDDEVEVVRRRLRTYHEQTRPLTAYYRDHGVLRTVDGSAEAGVVTRAIQEVCQPA